MSILNLGDPVLNKVLDDRVAKTQKELAPTFDALTDRIEVMDKSDTFIGWDVEIDGTAVGEGAVLDDTTVTASDDAIPAELRIGKRRIFRRFQVDAVAISEAYNRAPEGLSRILTSEVDNSIRELRRKLNQRLWTGNGIQSGVGAESGIAGINLVADPAATYAGINPVTYPIWKPAVYLDNGGTNRALDRGLLDELEEELYLQEISFDLVITSPQVKRLYAAEFDKVATYQENVNTTVDLGRGEYLYRGREMVIDPQCPADTMMFLNTGYMRLYSFLFLQGQGQLSAMTPQAKIVAATRLGGFVLYMAQLPSNNSAVYNFEMYIMPQLQYMNRKQLAVICDLGTPTP